MTCDMATYVVNLLHFPWRGMVMLVTLYIYYIYIIYILQYFGIF